MNLKITLAAMLLAATGAHAQGAIGPNGPGGPPPGGKMPPMAKTVEIQLQIEASANLKQNYPGSTADTITWHHGIGFLAPLGEVEYYCGKNFPEEKDFPLNDWQKGFFNQYTGRDDALFCTYTVIGGDTFYVRDSVSGTVVNYPDGGGRNMMINLVVGGTGKYKDATGVWTGFTEGVGRPAQGDRAPKVLLKVMTGYVKLPNDK